MKVNTSLDKLLGKNSQLAKQSAILFSANIATLVLGILVSILNTRFLGPQTYGDFKFLLNLFSLVIIVFTGGISITGGRLLALDEYKRKREEITGTLFSVTMIISVIVGITLFVYSFFQDKIFGTQGLGSTIRWCSLFIFVYPFEKFIEKLLEGSNRIYDLAIARVVPKIIYLGIIFITSFYLAVELDVAIGVHMLSLAVATFYVYQSVKPKFINIRENFALIMKMNKEHGLPMYMGTLIGRGSTYLGTLIIGFYLDNTSVGFYTLALTIATPLVMIPQSLGTVSYKKFANQNSIPTKVTLLTVTSALVVFILFNLLIEYVVIFVYSKEYYPVIAITRLVSFSMIVQGFCFYINRFLSSHGLGRQLRNADLIRGTINILGFIVLVQWIGIEGACYSLITSNTAVLIYLIIRYRRYTTSTYEVQE